MVNRSDWHLSLGVSVRLSLVLYWYIPLWSKCITAAVAPQSRKSMLSLLQITTKNLALIFFSPSPSSSLLFFLFSHPLLLLFAFLLRALHCFVCLYICVCAWSGFVSLLSPWYVVCRILWTSSDESPGGVGGRRTCALRAGAGAVVWEVRSFRVVRMVREHLVCGVSRQRSLVGLRRLQHLRLRGEYSCLVSRI